MGIFPKQGPEGGRLIPTFLFRLFSLICAAQMAREKMVESGQNSQPVGGGGWVGRGSNLVSKQWKILKCIKGDGHSKTTE